MSVIWPGTIVKVDIFDDGNSKFNSVFNEWTVKELIHGGGKLRLFNPSTNKEIPSISAWKVSVLKQPS